MVSSRMHEPQRVSGDKATVGRLFLREAAGRSVDELAQKENEVIIRLLKLRANGASAPPMEQEADRAKAII
jgi:hypothetical protein